MRSATNVMKIAFDSKEEGIRFSMDGKEFVIEGVHEGKDGFTLLSQNQQIHLIKYLISSLRVY